MGVMSCCEGGKEDERMRALCIRIHIRLGWLEGFLIEERETGEGAFLHIRIEREGERNG